MEMNLVGIKNQNEYYTNHYFTSIFKDNAEDTIKRWKDREKEENIQLPWKKLRDTSRQYYRIRDRYQHLKNEEYSKPLVQEMADLYLNALGYDNRNSVIAGVANGISVPVYHEEIKSNGAPLLWAFLCVAQERAEDILQSKIYEKNEDEDEYHESVELINDDILSKLFFAGEEAPRFILLIGINQIALIDRNKWNEKRYLQFMMEDIFSRHEESTFMAMTVLLHKESICPIDGTCVLDNLDEKSHKHSAGVSDALKYSLRESIEILGNEVIYDMRTRQGIHLSDNPVDASELTLECLRYMYRFLFMLFIEARPELGYAPMKSQTYVQGYSLEGLRDVCDRVKDANEVVSEGYYIDDTISELFRIIYEGYPGDLDEYKKALEQKSLHDVFTIEALKAHIFDPEYTKLITNAKLRNSAMLQIVDLMSISRSANSKERRGRISYSALGINQMGAVYEALLSYRGFIAEETLFEVKRAGDNFNELDVGYFVKEQELDNYDDKTERVRYEKGELKGQLRKYEKGTFIYRLAGREREKSASYYTPEVLTKCLVKYALKELLKDKTADDILNLTVCEPAMGSAAFLNEAINQLAEAYLNKKQEELGKQIAYDERFEELQRVKMYIADRNVYGVDLNPIAVELAEVSLWLNTIYKGAYVPWFGTQLVCGNSLIGARKQVYTQSQLESGKWYEKEPRRIMPGETRTKKGQHENTKEIYHFLLGDSGMSNYTDKVIKGLEPDNIKKINDWRKKFTEKFDEDDIQTVLRLSDTIDNLWVKTVEDRKKVEKATFEPLSVFGHEEIEQGTHTTIREKDEIYHKLFKSEHMNNAGPYARLKAAMDYWCALWFWPIDKADLLPSRQEYFFEMSLILEGGIAAVSTNSTGQMSLLDSTGNINLDESGNIKYSVEGSQLALDFQAQYADLGLVCLDDLRARSERLAIVNQIAERQKFHHWELEFADIFADKGGFDLLLGNPPWLKVTWNEQDLISEYQPIVAVKNMSAKEVTDVRAEIFESSQIYVAYLTEFASIAGQQNYMNASQNYYVLKGQQTNLYKCFLPQGWYINNQLGILGLLHPDGIFEDPKGGELRKAIYGRMLEHFSFTNQLKLFDIGNTRTYSLNVYSNDNNGQFESLVNLFAPQTVDECYEKNNNGDVPGIKNKDNWELRGHQNRRVVFRIADFLNLSEMLGESGNPLFIPLPRLHSTEIYSVIGCFASQKNRVADIKKSIVISQMWNETGAQKAGILVRKVHFSKTANSVIYSGAHIGVANPIFKTSQKICETHRSFDTVNLNTISEDYFQRTNYILDRDIETYSTQIATFESGERYDKCYRLVARKMIDPVGERTLISAIICPDTGHTNGLIGLAFKNIHELLVLSGSLASIPYDFFVKMLGKTNLYEDVIGLFPVINTKIQMEIEIRALMLNCLNKGYADLWSDFSKTKANYFGWLRSCSLLSKNKMNLIDKEWRYDSPLRNDYERREALIELDVLVAYALGMTCEQLKMIYKIQFPVAQQYDEDTWYDSHGNIVFTNNRSLSNVGIQRNEWEKIKDEIDGEYIFEIEDATTSDEAKIVSISYYAPFIKGNRIEEYNEIWERLEDITNAEN